MIPKLVEAGLAATQVGRALTSYVNDPLRKLEGGPYNQNDLRMYATLVRENERLADGGLPPIGLEANERVTNACISAWGAWNAIQDAFFHPLKSDSDSANASSSIVKTAFVKVFIAVQALKSLQGISLDDLNISRLLAAWTKPTPDVVDFAPKSTDRWSNLVAEVAPNIPDSCRVRLDMSRSNPTIQVFEKDSGEALERGKLEQFESPLPMREPSDPNWILKLTEALSEEGTSLKAVTLSRDPINEGYVDIIFYFNPGKVDEAAAKRAWIAMNGER